MLTVTSYEVNEGVIKLGLKGNAKHLPTGIEPTASKKGTIVVEVKDTDMTVIGDLGAKLKVNGDVAGVEKNPAHWEWFKTNFVPATQGGGAEGGDPDAAAADDGGEATTDESNNGVSHEPTEPAEAAAPEEDESSTSNNSKEAKVSKSKKSAKAATPKAEAKPAKSAPPKKEAPKKEAKAPKVAKPKKEKEPEPEVDTSDFETALIALAEQAGIRFTKVLCSRIGRRLVERGGKVSLAKTAPEVTTAGIIPGKSYTVTKNHARAGWGKCEYTVEILADSRIKLVKFSGDDAGRGLRSGKVYDTSKDLLKQVLKLDDPHVSFYKFFNL